MFGIVKAVEIGGKREFMTDNVKDLFDGIDDLGWVNKDEFEYCCESCSWQGDQANYEVSRDRHEDKEGYPTDNDIYLERCPECGFLLGF